MKLLIFMSTIIFAPIIMVNNNTIQKNNDKHIKVDTKFAGFVDIVYDVWLDTSRDTAVTVTSTSKYQLCRLGYHASISFVSAAFIPYRVEYIRKNLISWLKDTFFEQETDLLLTTLLEVYPMPFTPFTASHVTWNDEDTDKEQLEPLPFRVNGLAYKIIYCVPAFKIWFEIKGILSKNEISYIDKFSIQIVIGKTIAVKHYDFSIRYD